jgi:hypothetical protein
MRIFRMHSTGLLKLLDTPEHIPVFAPILSRKIHYRLLIGSYFRVLATVDKRIHRVRDGIE